MQYTKKTYAHQKSQCKSYNTTKYTGCVRSLLLGGDNKKACKME